MLSEGQASDQDEQPAVEARRKYEDVSINGNTRCFDSAYPARPSEAERRREFVERLSMTYLKFPASGYRFS